MLFFIYGVIVGSALAIGAMLVASILIQNKILTTTDKVAEPREIKLRGVKRPDNELARKNSTLQKSREMDEITAQQRYSGIRP